jgi:NADP-dependent alcohol dehydrogenase
MNSFTYCNPVQIVFGKGTIADLSDLIPESENIMITYGGGSIMKNGVYDQVMAALSGRQVMEFGGIEPNPSYETLMKAVEKAREGAVTYLLSVGGGSVLDGTKFISAAIPWTDGDPWDILSKQSPVVRAVPLGSVLTLPATGSEMNSNAVISRKSTREKLVFISPLVFPVFSILDPETTYSLPQHQTVNGIIDAFVHVMEQYMTYPVNAPLQDRQAESILLTLIEEAPKVLADPKDFDARANLMWSATHALNKAIGCGVPQDWGTHMIGHEITALYGLDHAVTLAIVLPALLSYTRADKKGKLLQFGERVWGITDGDDETRVTATIERTEKFFNELGIKTKFREYDIDQAGLAEAGARLDARGIKLGEHGKLTGADVTGILDLAY